MSIMTGVLMDDPIITLDIDWAPDFVIDFVADVLRQHGVRATWFVTHASAAIERLRENAELFELGIHPNFLTNSTHGTTPTEVLSHCMSLVPKATSMRTHSLYQSSPLLANVLESTSIHVDVSLFLPRAAHLQPVEYIWQEKTLLRIPFYWEDDFEMERQDTNWRLDSYCISGSGMKVFNFHPIHIYLNSADMKPYQALKKECPQLQHATPDVVNKHIYHGIGTRSIFIDINQHLTTCARSYCIRDVYASWQAGGSKSI
ncbi:hypothetical protein KFU94_27975 [Chloroflexi bacterium TSY]|nr:hypothetical protein [Chloroflexi bacterium TSY]